MRNRKDMGAKVPKDNFKVHEVLEDKLDLLLAIKALKEHGKDEFVPWEEIKTRYGLK